MNCAEAEQYLGERDRRAAEGAVDRIRLADHLRVCGGCRERWRELRTLERLARGLYGEVTAHGLWQRIEERLLAERTSDPTRVTRPGPRRWISLSAAAAILALCSATFFLSDSPASVPSPVMGEGEYYMLATEQASLERDLAKLEPIFRGAIETDNGASSLVAGQVEYLDATIEHCRELCRGNVKNRGLRRSLLYCTQRKRELIAGYLR